MTNVSTPQLAKDAVDAGVPIWRIISSLGVGGAIVALLRVMWSSRVPMRKIKVEAEQKFRDELLARVAKLEETNERIRNEYEAREAIQEAREAVLRHELQNTRTCFTAMLMLLRRVRNPPEELAEIIKEIESMRAEQMRSEELERAALPSLKPAKAAEAPKPTA